MVGSSRGSIIESTPPPAVSSLRSRFEQLAADSFSRPQSALLVPDPSSPRPRAVSGTQEPRPQQHGHLRSASSSSDLNTGIKRPPPPPPPPPRASSRSSLVSSAAPTPSASPLLRPVPIPNSSNALHGSSISPGKSPSMSLQVEDEASSMAPVGGVASLRNIFSNTPTESPSRAHTPVHQGFGNIHPAYHSDHDLVDLHPPALPPRHAHTTDSSRVALFSPTFMNRKDHMPSSRVEMNSPFLDAAESDSEKEASRPSAPPSLPPRRIPPPVTLVINGSASDNSRYQSSENTMSSDSSLMSTESDDTSMETHFPKCPAPPPRPSVVVPPPPPPRPKTYRSGFNTDSPSSASSVQIPPPLPIRRSTAAPLEDTIQSNPPPRLPVRPTTVVPELTTSPTAERKPTGLGRLPPPPTRTIALGEKLPPARRPQTPSSDEESGDETDSRSGTDQLPDSSRSSRRPPLLDCFKYNEAKIPVQAHSGQVAVSGSHVVVTSHHHVRIYDLMVSESPMWSLDTKNLHMKDSKVTSVEFRPAGRAGDRGFFFWVGTKEGHLFEIDVRSGVVTGSKVAAHGHSVSHIFRHGRSMITLDTNGKALIFTPDEQEDVQLTNSQPRVFRIPEKQEFARILGGLLWTSTRADMIWSAPAAKIPIIRVYDIFSPGSVGRNIQPTEHVGAVTSGSILPSHPQNVYLGHEGGFISIWSISDNDGIPQCLEVMKVSASDVLSLEGVGERLWAGGRKGMISAYDVVPRPWLVTNAWNAHSDLPVLRIATDPYSIEKLGRLCVVSVGRDEQLRLWDGLLSLDWIDQELLKRETSFSTFRNLSLLIISWNMDAAKPDALEHDLPNISFLNDVLTSVDSPDIISFGFQEVIDLESRRMTAKTVLLGGKKKGHDDGKISEKVTPSYKRWHDRLVQAVRLAMPPNSPYTVIETENLVGLFSCMFIKSTERISLKDVAITTIKRGMGGRYGNKGGIVARFTIDDTSICMINCHLAAGQHHVRQRNADVAAMVEEKSVFPSVSALEEAVAYVGGGDGSMVMDHEIVFVNGDMNYRIDYRRDPIIAAIQARDFETLVMHDQLTKEMKFNRGFRFRTFAEGRLTFAPTYKYDRNSTEYDTSEKRRLPAWCDRVLWRSREPSRVKQLHYRRWEANVSDHRPISAGFNVTVKSVRQELRSVVKSEVQGIWVAHQRELLITAREYYVSQALI